MTTSNRSRAAMRALILSGTGAALAVTTPLGAETRTRVDVALGARYSTNPFMITGTDTEAGAVTLEVSPVLDYTEGRTTVTARGRVLLEQFTRRYGFVDNYDASLGAVSQVSDRFALRGGVNFRSSRTSSYDRLLGGTFDGTGVYDPTSPTPLPLTDDLTIAGRGSRITTYGVNAGFTYQPSTRDRFDMDGSVTRTRSGTAGTQDYDFYRSESRYLRALNERTSVTASVGLGYADYRGGTTNNSFIVSPMVGVSHRLSERLTATGAVGASFVRREGVVVGDRTTTILSGRASLCSRGELSNFCLNGERSALPTLIGNVRTVTSVGTTYSRRVGPNDTIDASASYNLTGAARNPAVVSIANEKTEYYGVSVGYTRRLTEKLSAFVRGSLADISQPSLQRRANAEVNIGLRTTFGRTR